MSSHTRGVVAVFCTCMLGTPVAIAQEGAGAQAGQSTPKTVKAAKSTITASATLKGIVEGDATTEISVRTKSITGPLTVAKSVDHGASVNKDAVLLAFDAEKLEKQVTVASEERELAVLAIRQAELELPVLKRQLPVDLQSAEREKEQTAHDLDRFLKIDKPRLVDEARFGLKSALFNVEFARDELKQLEKMYRDKDLTEETEQMILKRYQFSLESAENSLRSAKDRTERTLTIDLPRREEAAQLAAVKADLGWERAREQLPLAVRQKELALEKLRFDDKRARERLEELRHDLEQMKVTAPVAGIVYHGRYARGVWSGPASSTAFRKGGSLPVNEVVLTIVSKGGLFVFADVEEKDVGDIQVGQAAKFSPTRSPRRTLAGKVERVAAVPQGGKFELLVALAPDTPEEIVPGLTGSLNITTVHKESVLVVPSSAVFENAENGTSYVYLAGAQPRPRNVKTGAVAGGKTEIVEGLSEGEEILTSKP